MGRLVRVIGAAALASLLTLVLIGTGDAMKRRGRRIASAQAPRLERPGRYRPAAEIPAARPAPMVDTPLSLLTLCQKNELLRPVCPRRLPAWGSAPMTAPGYYCQTANPHESLRQTLVSFGTKRCLFAEWDYIGGQDPRGWTANTPVQGWDGERWVADEFAMLSPPLHMGVQIQAARGSFPELGAFKWPEGAEPVSDSLLGPSGTEAVSLGWVRWYGRDGQLVLTPWGTCDTGAQLVLYLPPDADRVSYTITVDGWMPALRLGRKPTARVVRFQSGPALPHVIATLKAMFASAFGAQYRSASLIPRGTPGSHR